MVKTLTELGIDLKQELSDFEDHLIKTGVLVDKSGDSYYKIYEIIKETGDINFKFQYSFIDSIKSRIDNFEFSNVNTDCLKLADKTEKSKKYKKSKIFQLKVAMDSIQTSNIINVSTAVSVILRILNPKDFEHDYYKMTTLLLLVTTQDVDSGILRKLPPMPTEKQTVNVDSRDLLLVYVTTDTDSVMLNERKAKIDDLAEIVKKYLLNDSKDTTMPEFIPKHIDLIGDCYQSKLIILLQNDRGTRYSTYIKVQNQLTDGYKMARNEKALEYFDLEFKKLTIEQQSSIKELIPMRISEAEPTR